MTSDLERLEYEKGWSTCCLCGCKRPLHELGAELTGEVRVYVCLDATWCEKARAAKARREALAQEGRECTASPDCAEPREPGGTVCAHHRLGLIDPEGEPYRDAPVQHPLPLDEGRRTR